MPAILPQNVPHSAKQRDMAMRRNKVLILHKKGYKDQEIADELDITKATVKKDLEHLYKTMPSYASIIEQRETILAEMMRDLYAITTEALPDVLSDVQATDKYFKATSALFKLLGVGTDVKDLIAMLVAKADDNPDNFADMMIKIQMAYDQRAEENRHE